jgi:hypothetical protein
MHIHAHAINYLVWHGLLELSGVNGLAATPFLVINVHRTEQLQRSVSIWQVQQQQQGSLEVFMAQLAVCAVGRRELETGYPIRVIIDDKMDTFMRQEMQEGEEGGLRQSAASMPHKELYGQAQVSSRSFSDTAITKFSVHNSRYLHITTRYRQNTCNTCTYLHFILSHFLAYIVR